MPSTLLPPQPGTPTPTPLLTSTACASQTHLIVGLNPLASARCTRSLSSGATVILLSPPPPPSSSSPPLHAGLQQRIDSGEVQWLPRDFQADDLTTLGRDDVDGVVDMVFVTVPPVSAGGKLCAQISSMCRRLRIPVNIADAPSLCTFTLLSTYTDGPLQIGVTTAGNGCKLAGRIRREIASALPDGIGGACVRVGELRRRLRRRLREQEQEQEQEQEEGDAGEEEEGEEEEQRCTFNILVSAEAAEAEKTRRIRWLSQICEYWPLQKLCALTDADIDELLQSYTASASSTNTSPSTPSTVPPPPSPPSPSPQGTIHLVGSGPGHPDLLTLASLKALQSADLILADKLVPSAVLSLAPRRAHVHIARKFPGNAEAAQAELLALALSGLQRGQRVVRLKQGDPYIYGRGGEEVEFFRLNGYAPVVLPGITSALSAPLFAGVPATHRGVADQVLVCTGTGRRGVAPPPPEYVESRTVVFLMALHRLEGLVESLVGNGWPVGTPCAVVERASCPDQRVIRTTLANVCAAVEEEGSRPPGLIIVGWACEVLYRPGKKWVVEDGFKGI